MLTSLIRFPVVKRTLFNEDGSMALPNEQFSLTDDYRYFNFDNFLFTSGKLDVTTACGQEVVAVHMKGTDKSFYTLKNAFDELFDVNSHLTSRTYLYQGDTKL